jgi:hypothetical protein
MRRVRGSCLVLSAALAVCVPARVTAQGTAGAVRAPATTPFAQAVERLSEPGGFFDTDNLISNEPSYLHVIGRLADLGVSGGAYIGVGPDQNYSYVAAIKPRVAYMMDIRRDNALQHLMYKALFARSRNRLEFLCRWLGRVAPPDIERWTAAPIEQVLAQLEAARTDSATSARERRETLAQAVRYGVPLSTRDRETILRFHGEFQRLGLDLRFTSLGRSNAAEYPSLRQLILATDDRGTRSSYLAQEAAWREVKAMHAADRIIPVVGDLAGSHAVKAIGDDVTSRGLMVSAIYTSNAELYVLRDGGYASFAANVASLPTDGRSVIIRSYFNRGARHPLAVSGYLTTQSLHRVTDFVRRFRAGALTSYWNIVTLDAR